FNSNNVGLYSLFSMRELCAPERSEWGFRNYSETNTNPIVVFSICVLPVINPFFVFVHKNK
ncbi:MAG: hypothetical protein Q8R09_03070, partial [Anaerolineaceae bacterium]|nr:hypothetical protein [Anaerolineaceae bacterium]